MMDVVRSNCAFSGVFIGANSILFRRSGCNGGRGCVCDVAMQGLGHSQSCHRKERSDVAIYGLCGLTPNPGWQ
jgi:hypothetical protein